MWSSCHYAFICKYNRPRRAAAAITLRYGSFTFGLPAGSGASDNTGRLPQLLIGLFWTHVAHAPSRTLNDSRGGSRGPNRKHNEPVVGAGASASAKRQRVDLIYCISIRQLPSTVSNSFHFTTPPFWCTFIILMLVFVALVVYFLHLLS